MRLQGGVIPDGGETLHEISRGDDIYAQCSNRVDRSGIDPGDIGDRSVRRVLHRDGAGAGYEVLDLGPELLMACVEPVGSRQVGKTA